MEIYNLVSLGGIVFLLAFAWILSEKRTVFPWRAVLIGLGLQILFAVFIFFVPWGAKLFLFLNDVVLKILDCAREGAVFVFGRLAVPPGEVSSSGEPSLGFFLAFQALPTIIFFASLMAILYYFGIMQVIIKGFAYLFTKLMRVSGAESLSVSSNIFVGIESSLAIKPYLNKMTRSELCTILTGGMATIASSVMALYVMFLKNDFPSIAGHLISASILSAPAAIMMSKIIVPETGIPVTLGKKVEPVKSNETSLFEAIINGAQAGLKLITGITTLLIAFLGLVALFDLGLSSIGLKINGLFGWHIEWTIKNFLGLIFTPFSVCIGIPLEDVRVTADIIGERLVLTEVQAYHDLAVAVTDGVIKHPRSIVITAYALCGFAHVASLAIFTGGIAALVPEKTKELAKIGPKALLCATLACLLTAAIAGVFFNHTSVLFSNIK